MLHYSNASSIEKSRRYLVIRGLAWLLWQEEGVVVNVADHKGIGDSLGAYRKEVTEGEHNK